MSVQKVYTVYDSKGEFYLPPFLMKTRGEALRAFETISNDMQSAIGRYPADYTLFEIGEFDEIKGGVKMFESKVSLGCAIEFKKQPVAAVESINK